MVNLYQMRYFYSQSLQTTYKKHSWNFLRCEKKKKNINKIHCSFRGFKSVQQEETLYLIDKDISWAQSMKKHVFFCQQFFHNQIQVIYDHCFCIIKSICYSGIFNFLAPSAVLMRKCCGIILNPESLEIILFLI